MLLTRTSRHFAKVRSSPSFQSILLQHAEQTFAAPVDGFVVIPVIFQPQSGVAEGKNLGKQICGGGSEDPSSSSHLQIHTK